MTYHTALTMLVWMALGILVILVRENGRISKHDKRILYLTFLVVALSALAEWLGVRLNGNADIPTKALQLVKFFDYTLTPVAGGIIVLQFRTKDIWKKLLLLLLVINTVFQIVSFRTGWMLTIGPDHRYSHGPAYFVYILIYILVTLLVIMEFAEYGRKFRRQNRVSLYGILIFVVSSFVMQELTRGEIRASYLALTIAFALLFIHFTEYSQIASDDRIQEQMIKISVDPLTGIASRHAYMEAVQKLSSLPSLPEDLAVFLIDLNGLKDVNDRLGHRAGDELICGAAQCIATVFEDCGTCYRTGGDEFVVLAHPESGSIPALLKQLSERAAAWHGSESSGLSFSVGTAIAAEHPGFSAEELIHLADREMYQAKAAFYLSNGNDRRKKTD